MMTPAEVPARIKGAAGASRVGQYIVSPDPGVFLDGLRSLHPLW